MFMASSGLPAHGVYVAQGVGNRHLPELEGVIDDRREEVHRLDQGYVLVQLVDGGVVRSVDPNEEVRVRDLRQLAQHLRQVLWTELRGSPRAAGEACQTDLVLDSCHFLVLPYICGRCQEV